MRLRSVVASVSLCLCAAATAVAQTPLPSPEHASSAPAFLAHYNFHLSADALSKSDDQRFTWQTHFGGDLDLLDYVVGRANVLIDYEAVLGNEIRAFDPNQGNYTLEVSASARAGATELAGIFHHVSRHLGDRPKRFAIAWNELGVRVLRRLDAADTTVDAQASIGRIVQHSYVDYSWTGNADLVVRRRLTPVVGAFAHGFGELVAVDASVAGRKRRQLGGRIDAGVRLNGRAGALELFAGVERRVDADPLDRQPQHWVLAGFRFVNR